MILLCLLSQKDLGRVIPLTLSPALGEEDDVCGGSKLGEALAAGLFDLDADLDPAFRGRR